MIRPRSLLALAFCSTAAVGWVVGCSATSDAPSGSGQAGAGTAAHAGSGSAGSPGSSGSSNVGQSGSAAGGAPSMGSAGTGVAGTAPMGGAGRSSAGMGGAATSGGGGASTAGSGGASTAGAGGHVSTGGSGGMGMTTMPGMSAGCGKAPTIAASTYNNGNPITISAANMMRRYILRVPTTYDNTKPYKLVIAYHARDSNDHTVYTQNYYGLSSLSNNTTIFVAPNGRIFVPGPTPNMQWYDLTGGGSIQSAGRRGDDVFSQNDVTVLYDVGKLLKALGFSHVSARPRHPGQDARVMEEYKKTSRRS